MKTYTIRRRNVWQNMQQLEATAEISLRVADEDMHGRVRPIRSYVVDETNGTLGTTCIYQAVSAEAIREHSRRVGIPANEITPVAKTVLIREDPEEFAEAA